MKNLSYLLAICLIFSGLVLSCSKNYNDVAIYSSMDDVFASLSVQPSVTTIDATAGGSFYGASGTRYIFAPNSFQTASGATVTGKVQVTTSEYQQKGDMIFSKMLPISNNEPLLSGGEINVSASQNGQNIFMKPGTSFRANMPLAANLTGNLPAGIAFFAGRPNPDTTQFRTNWIQAADTNQLVGIAPSIAGDTLGIISDSLRECNADAFMANPDFQSFSVTAQVAGTTFNSSYKVCGYTLYDNYKGVWPLGLIGSYANGVFNELHVPNIPVHFVIFTLINGKFYGGIGAATPATGSNYNVTLKNVNPVTFKTEVDAL